jgi:hypothetical protein
MSYAAIAEAIGLSSADAARLCVVRCLVRLAKEMKDVADCTRSPE